MKQIKRILAMIGVSLLLLMYLATLLCALFDNSSGMLMFKASVMCTVLVPILIWGYTVIYRLARGKNEQELQDTLNKLDAKHKQQKQEPSSSKS